VNLFEILPLLVIVVTCVFVGWQTWLSATANKRAADALELSARANVTQNLMAVFTIEDAVSDARSQLEAAAHLASSETSDANDAHRSAKQEAYLNAVDRLCRSIRMGVLNEAGFQTYYRDTFQKLLMGFSESFGPGHSFKNIVYVHECWAENKTAVDMRPTLDS